MDQRRRPRPDSRAGRYLQTVPIAPHARDEGIPLDGSKPEDSTLRVLAVPHVDALRIGRDFNAFTALVRPRTLSPHPAGVVTAIADIFSRHGGMRHMSVPAPQPQDGAAIVAIVLVVAAVCARYWRTVLLMIMISLLICTVLGLIAGLHDMQHVVR
jgi:hypothetical protein